MMEYMVPQLPAPAWGSSGARLVLANVPDVVSARTVDRSIRRASVLHLGS